MKWIFFIFSMIIASNLTVAQQYFELHNGGSTKLHIEAKVAQGYTLYGLSASTGSSVDELIAVNKKNSKSLSINELLILPIEPVKIANTTAELKKPTSLYYTTQPGDNLFRIAQKVGTPTEDLMHLNAKSSSSLALGERLLIGWIDWPYQLTVQQDEYLAQETSLETSQESKTIVTQTAEQKAVVILKPLPLLNFNSNVASTLNLGIAGYNPIVPDLSEGSIPPTVVKEKGIAFWQKAAYESKELIVMHRHAKVNSKISLYNPMLKRKVDAKVVSELPKESYSDDISVVISPSVATALGALDRRFLVEITYVE